jgi:ornithine decarboxylase/arginine decarboxylase
MYLSDLQPAMTPSDAYACIARRQTERVPIDRLEGRITTSLLTPYPPGIPLLIPGERFNRRIVDFLRFARDFNAAFPGFATDVHGLIEVVDDEGRRGYAVDCVRDG